MLTRSTHNRQHAVTNQTNCKPLLFARCVCAPLHVDVVCLSTAHCTCSLLFQCETAFELKRHAHMQWLMLRSGPIGGMCAQIQFAPADARTVRI